MSAGFLAFLVVLFLLCQRYPLCGVLVLGVLPVSGLAGLLYVFWTNQMWWFVGLWCVMVFLVLPLGLWVERRVPF